METIPKPDEVIKPKETISSKGINIVVKLSDTDPRNFANGIIFGGYVIIPEHIVAGQERVVVNPKNHMTGKFKFTQLPGQDLAISHAKVPDAIGYESTVTPAIGDLVQVVGYHDITPQNGAFEYIKLRIEAKVVAIGLDGRVILEHVNGKKFQLGMSGTAAETENGELVGLLSGGVDDTGDHQVYFEPVKIPSK